MIRIDGKNRTFVDEDGKVVGIITNMSIEIRRDVFMSECFGGERYPLERERRVILELSAEIVNMDDWDRASNSPKKQIAQDLLQVDVLRSESLLLEHKK